MKRYSLIVYKSKYTPDNYGEDIYTSGNYDNKEETAIIKETSTFTNLLKIWKDNFKFYEGYLYCVRDRGRSVTLLDPDENIVIGGVYNRNDEEILLDYYKYGRTFE